MHPGVMLDYEIDINQLDQDFRLETAGFQSFTQDIFFKTHTNGYTKILTISDTQTEKVNYDNESHNNFSVNLQFKALGISLIGELNDSKVMKKIRKELLYFSISNIQFVMLDFNTHRKFQFKIHHMQVDN
jgi:hypothetical protein